MVRNTSDSGVGVKPPPFRGGRAGSPEVGERIADIRH